MATYYASGIWTNNQNVITDLKIHLVSDNSVHQATRQTLAQVIGLIESGHEIYTCNWIYANRHWQRGARVHVVSEGGQKYLRTNRDAQLKDNLDNMLSMGNLGC